MNENISRVEALLKTILGSEFTLEAPRSRVEQILKDIIDEVDPVSITPKSRVENLLIGLASAMSHSTARLTSLTISQNGRYFPGEGYDGFNYVEVDIDVSSNLHFLSVSENGLYTPDSGYDGFNTVEVNVPSVVLQSLIVTENGTYTPDPEGSYSGFDYVEVNVPASGFYQYQSVSGTLSNVFTNIGISFNSIIVYLNNLYNVLKVKPWADIDASQIGMGTGGGVIVKYGENGQYSIKLLNGQVDSSSSLAFTVTWDSTGLVSAYAEQDGTITDLMPYASSIDITVYLPMGDDI